MLGCSPQSERRICGVHFTVSMERTLGTYQAPSMPVVWMDETPIQQFDGGREQVPEMLIHYKGVDDE